MINESIRKLVNGALPSPPRGRATRRKPSFSGDEPENGGPHARTKRNRRTRRSKEPESDPIAHGAIEDEDTQEVVLDRNSSKKTGVRSSRRRSPAQQATRKSNSRRTYAKSKEELEVPHLKRELSSRKTKKTPKALTTAACAACADTHAAAQRTASENDTTIEAPARHINVHNGALSTLVMDPHMQAYHGSKPIPDNIRKMRDYIKNECITKKGNLTTKGASVKYKDDFRSDGRVPKDKPFKGFYMDLRLFNAVLWDRLMTEWRKEGWRNHAQLGKFQDQLAGAVLPPSGYDYEANLFPRKTGEEDEEEEDDEEADADADVEEETDGDDEIDDGVELVVAADGTQVGYESPEEARSRAQLAAEDAARDRELDEMDSEDDIEMEDADASGLKEQAN